jgi:hypothetical protein
MKLVKPVAFVSSLVWVLGLSLVIGSALFIPDTVVAWRQVTHGFASAALLIVGVLLTPYLPEWRASWKNRRRRVLPG